MKITVRYFAALRDQRGLSHEILETQSLDPEHIYAELGALHGFTLSASQVRFAVNGQYVEPGYALAEGNELVFIPPVAGG
ncbi:MAG: MoaD/ThiS family protein [Fimbriimonadaceae bacterium]|nr:MoaD/ThiS family protein [Fimbriimonadaceae bacterium]